MIFDYTFQKNTHIPLIDVTLTNSKNIIKVNAVVDSGAAISLFKGSVARELGIKLEDGEKKIFQTASSKLVGYIHEVHAEVAGNSFECKIAFSDDLGTSFNMLGRLSVFENFLIKFDERKKQFSFEK